MSRLIEDIINEMVSKHSKNGYVDLSHNQLLGYDVAIMDKVFETAPTSNQFTVDSEVLLSYIYRKLGLTNPQSIPVTANNKTGVMREKITHGKDYIHDEMNMYRSGYLYFDNLNEASRIHTFYDKELMDSYIKISLADMMFWIQDRYPSRLFIRRGGKYGMKEVVPTNFSFPSYIARDESLVYRFQPFYNGVFQKEETRNYYKKRLKTFDFKYYLTPEQFYELIGKIDIKQCAKEIYEKYNYKVNPKFVDFVERTLDASLQEFNSKFTASD